MLAYFQNIWWKILNFPKDSGSWELKLIKIRFHKTKQNFNIFDTSNIPTFQKKKSLTLLDFSEIHS